MCMFFWESFVFQYGLFIPENTKAANVCVCSHRVFVNLLLKCYSLNECTVCIICLKTWSWYRNTWNLIFQFFFFFLYKIFLTNTRCEHTHTLAAFVFSGMNKPYWKTNDSQKNMHIQKYYNSTKKNNNEKWDILCVLYN
jgi:hypothetical protein